MSGIQKVYDLKDENQAKEYLDNLGVEYRFQVGLDHDGYKNFFFSLFFMALLNEGPDAR